MRHDSLQRDPDVAAPQPCPITQHRSAGLRIATAQFVGWIDPFRAKLPTGHKHEYRRQDIPDARNAISERACGTEIFGLVRPPRHSLARRRDGYRSALAFTKPPGTFGLPASVKSS
jgi:hypothetical protein